MDIKIKIKEEEPLTDDIVSQHEKKLFTKAVITKTDSDAMLLEDCDVPIKTEIKSEFEEQTLVLDFGSQNTREFSPEGPVMKIKECTCDYEMDNKIEIEEHLWLETDTSSVCDKIEDGDFPPENPSRLCQKAVFGDICVNLPLPSAEVSGGDRSSNNANGHPECESKDSHTELPLVGEYVDSEQSTNCSDGKIYREASNLKQNNLINNGNRSHRCNVCRTKHQKCIHGSKGPPKCKSCGKCFTRFSDLKRHNLIHEGRKLHQCKSCSKSFTVFSNLKRHNLIIHEGTKPYNCKVCDRSFSRYSDLKTHNLIHEGKKPHHCNICDKRFTQSSNLKTHNLIHEGKKTYQCKICDKRFIQSSVLKRHTLIHEGKKDHQCKSCSKSFGQLSHLKRHILIHEGKRQHQCKSCSKSFTQFSHLKRHILIH